MSRAGKTIRQRLSSLEAHLKKESPALVPVVQSYRHLDDVARTLGLLDAEQSFATQISWWPMISVLGTFSAGKSTFINHFLGETLQQTGNQAVDDKFTVICYGAEQHAQTLPGSALDADPRFPFYQISNELEKVARGEGRRVDTYLQLKTSASDKLHGRIIIDSPGFDADSQRNATLRLTDHIIDLSDLVLVFFDARHPEPGAMRDTLKHLVGDTIHRPDATKFVFILNQMDTTAREDNPEEVVGAWQRALAQEGLTAGRFYSIYNPEVAVVIENDTLRARYEAKRDHDLNAIHDRIARVDVERAYRITGALEKLAHHIEEKLVPRLTAYRTQWRRSVLLGDAGLSAVFLLLAVFATGWLGMRSGWQWNAPAWWQGSTANMAWSLIALAGLLLLFGFLHFRLRKLMAARVLKQIDRQYAPGLERERLRSAFSFNTRPWVNLFRRLPVGWHSRTRKRLHRVIAEANLNVQSLNNSFTDPSGKVASGRQAAVPLKVVSPATDQPSAKPTEPAAN